MKKQIVILAIALILIVVTLTGCFDGSNESTKELKKFVGTWKPGTLPNGRSITFFSNGSSIYFNDLAEWKLENNRLVIELTYRDMSLTFDYEFLDNDQTLILTDINTDLIEDYKKI